jgi:hypothetical protein
MEYFAGKDFPSPLFSIFCEGDGGGGTRGGDIIYIKYIDLIVHMMDLAHNRTLSGPFVAAKTKRINILPVTHLDGIACDINGG